MMKPMRLREKIKMVFAKPGWTPTGPSPQEQIAAVDLNRDKYDTRTPNGLNIYVFVQFIFILWAVVAYMNHFDTMSVFYQWFFAGLMLLSMTISGGIFENKKWVFFAEYVRLIMVAISVSIFYYQWYIEWFVPMVVFASISTAIFYIWFSISLSRNYKTILAN
jgi:hypothetical protein